eukprot:scaffold223969_cov30-Tisochrysis_lutea.AAC.11
MSTSLVAAPGASIMLHASFDARHTSSSSAPAAARTAGAVACRSGNSRAPPVTSTNAARALSCDMKLASVWSGHAATSSGSRDNALAAATSSALEEAAACKNGGGSGVSSSSEASLPPRSAPRRAAADSAPLAP